MLNVSVATPADLGAWQEYVDRHDCARPMHHAGWYDVLQDAFRVRCVFLMARDGNASVHGILPMYFSRSIVAGTHLASLDDGTLTSSADAEQALLNAAMQQRDLLRADYLLVRTGKPVVPPVEPTVIRPTVRRVIQTSDAPEDLFLRCSSYARRDVRRAEKRGYRVVNDETLEHLDGAFYDEYARQVHELGTPVMGRSFMKALRERLGSKRVRLSLLHDPQGIVGGMVCVTAARHWTALYAAVRHAAAQDYANYLLYWHTLSEACRAGVPHIDLGRNTPGSGVHKFKQKWAGEDCYADHLYFARGTKALGSVSALHEGQSLKQRVWMKLPLALANRIGPLLRHSLPFG